MKKTAFAFLLLLVNIIAQAQIPNGYYDNASGKTGQELRSALHEIIKGHTTVSYQQIWSTFWTTDNKGNNVVWDMYSDGANYTYNYNNDNDQCGSYDSEGDCYNREHTWPKSWFSGGEDGIPGRDLHHIFPTDGFVNAQRSNYPFGEVQTASWTSQNGSKLGTCKSSLNYNGIVFEPIDEYKGDFARSMMYLSVRYYNEDSNWGSSDMTDKSVIRDWAIEMLMDWSDNDPVSKKETDRNNAVYGIQSNRNPFIDHPEYARMIWDPTWAGVVYDISFATVQHGSITASANNAQPGTTITLGNTPANGYALYSYYVYKTGDISTVVHSGSNNTFVMPPYDVTVTASFVQPSSCSYVKAASEPSDWSGEYILVYENSSTEGFVWTGVNTSNCYVSKTINGDTIANDDYVTLTVASMTGGYSIKINGGTNNNKYIYGTSGSNSISFGNDPSLNTISIESEGPKIVSNTSVLRYNTSSIVFRYYKSSTYTNQAAIQLYKKITSSVTPSHTIYFNNNGGTGSMNSQTVNEFEPTALQTNTFTREGFVFNGWNTASDGTGDYYADGATVTLLSDLTLYAQWESTTPHYHLVTSTDQLVAGRTFLIVNTTAAQALSTTQNNNNRSGVEVSVSDGVITTIGSTACELTLGGSTGAWTFFDANWGDNGGYLYAASSGSNILKTQATNDANGQWSIEFATNGTATIVAQGTNSRNNLRYNPNSGSPIFSCYASSSNMEKVELYIRSEEFNHAQSKTISHLFAFDRHTIHSGATLTVSGTASCDDANNLIIEDGAQLVHHTDGVQATFKKSITAYSTNGNGWYTLGLPFTNLAPSQLADGNYDLYVYDEDAALEWVNYKALQGNFTIEPGQGYLYAHNPSTTLSLTGTLTNGDYSETINLSYGNSDANLRGFNLLGNPTAHDITFTPSESVSDGYYYLNNHEEWQYATGNNVPAGRGFLVKANAANQSVTLNPQSRGESHDKGQFISIGIDGQQAFVKTSDGVSMPLLDFHGKASSVYLIRNGEPYAMLVRENADAIDLCYKPKYRGQHTLSVTANDLDYLHLIDHKTGADIDLLDTPSYDFESTGGDYPSRFQLRFSADSGSDSDPFAYYADGRIVVNGEGTLRIYDLTGRMVDNSKLTPGVYVLRLITPDKAKIQKLIINK